jgi:hypothetical protein
VLFSLTLATSRLLYTLLLQYIISNRFTIVSVDHLYDADIVEYPNSRTVLRILVNLTNAEYAAAMNIYIKDILFLLD